LHGDLRAHVSWINQQMQRRSLRFAADG